jgi:hypothetical protein
MDYYATLMGSVCPRTAALAVKVKDNNVVVLPVFPVLRDPPVWTTPLTTAIP